MPQIKKKLPILLVSRLAPQLIKIINDSNKNFKNFIGSP